MELTGGEMEGKDLPKIKHGSHDHPLVLREPLQGHGGYGDGRLQVYCDGCKEPISSSSSSSLGAEGGGGPFYACPSSNCWYVMHKRCAELPAKIEHPSHPDHALTLHFHLLRPKICDACNSDIDGFLYRCSLCDFGVHVRCASMALHVQDRVDENKIHQHPLIPIEMEAQFLCAACSREHKGKSYLCPICGFWANQICASAPTTIDIRRHPHPLTLFRSFRCHPKKCEICNEAVKRAYWVYCCSEKCDYGVHVGCSRSEEAENSNKDIQTNFHSKSTGHKIEIPMDLKEEVILISWPLLDESVELITQLIKNLSSEGRHKRATKIFHCIEDHQLIFVNKKIDESKDDQLCDGCTQTISSQFYHCPQCNFSLHEWCAKLPNELRHILHIEHPLHLFTQKQDMHFPPTYCNSCNMYTNEFVFNCIICDFNLDLKCALLLRLIKHRVHDHILGLKRVTNKASCNACGINHLEFSSFFQCEACNFRLCLECALLPFSVKHKYDKHPFALAYSPIKGQPDDYYCKICEEDINSTYWFYHCIKCDQSLHPKCIYPIERYWNVKFGVRFKVNSHSHLLRCVRCPIARESFCRNCGCQFRDLNDYMVYECEQCNFWIHPHCLHSF